MRTFIKSRVVEAFFGLCLVFWVFAPFMGEATRGTLLTGALMSCWLGLLIAYWKGVWRIVRDPKSQLGGKLVMIGIAGCALGIVGVFAWSLAFQYMDQPESMRNHIFRHFLLWVFLVSSVMMVIAGGVDTNKLMPGENWHRIGTVIAVAVILTILLVYLVGGFPS